MTTTKIYFTAVFIALLNFFSCNEAKYMQGKRTYDLVCGDCHMEDGSGVVNLYPKLKPINSSVLTEDLPCIIRYGVSEESSLIKMPPNPALKAVDITNIMNYILVDMNNSAKEYTLQEIESLLENCEPQESKQ